MLNRNRPTKPARRRPSNVLQFEQPRRRQSKSKKARWPWAVLIASPIVGIGVAWLWNTAPGSSPAGTSSLLSRTPTVEQFNENFSECSGPIRFSCVVDGDTFWLQGEKIRIADINAPEVSEPQCPSEAQLGARATERLIVLLNAGAFSLETADRDEDQYGRKLRVVTRGGKSLGETLVNEGLAERWKGYRGSWC